MCACQVFVCLIKCVCGKTSYRIWCVWVCANFFLTSFKCVCPCVLMCVKQHKVRTKACGCISQVCPVPVKRHLVYSPNSLVLKITAQPTWRQPATSPRCSYCLHGDYIICAIITDAESEKFGVGFSCWMFPAFHHHHRHCVLSMWHHLFTCFCLLQVWERSSGTVDYMQFLRRFSRAPTAHRACSSARYTHTYLLQHSRHFPKQRNIMLLLHLEAFGGISLTLINWIVCFSQALSTEHSHVPFWNTEASQR